MGRTAISKEQKKTNQRESYQRCMDDQTRAQEKREKDRLRSQKRCHQRMPSTDHDLPAGLTNIATASETQMLKQVDEMIGHKSTVNNGSTFDEDFDGGSDGVSDGGSDGGFDGGYDGGYDGGFDGGFDGFGEADHEIEEESGDDINETSQTESALISDINEA